MALEQQEGMSRQTAANGREGDGGGGSLNAGDTQGSGGNPQNSVVPSASEGEGAQTANANTTALAAGVVGLEFTRIIENWEDQKEAQERKKDPTWLAGGRKRMRESGKKIASVRG
jgi:hypothetical protein